MTIQKLKTLVSESWKAAVLDSGNTNSLNENEKQKIKHHTPGNTYRFWDRNYFHHFKLLTYQSHWEAEMWLNTDIIVSDIPLLLSRKSMKKTNMTLDFKNDHAASLINQLVTKSGHYTIPINPYKTTLNNVTS